MKETISENAFSVAAGLGTPDVFEIARSNGVTIVYGSWHPITIGEFERCTKTIRVNTRALVGTEHEGKQEIKIIAHELGHFFATSMEMNSESEEAFAHAFAMALVGS